MKKLHTGSRLPGRIHSMAAAAASAAILLAGMPGRLGWWPLLFIALVPLLRVLLYLPPRRTLCTGFFFGLLYNIGLLYWIVFVVGHYGGLPVYLSVPAMLLLASYMAVYPALFCFLTSLFAGRSLYRERSLINLLWAAPIFWVGLEYLRSRVLDGFPWMDLGYGLAAQPVLVQAADLGGHYLLSFTLVLTSCLVVYGIGRQHAEVRWHERRDRRLALFFVAFLMFLVGYSWQRFAQIEHAQQKAMQVNVNIVQGNIEQDLKWSSEEKEHTVAVYERLTRESLQKHKAELVVWPETALPFYPDRDPLFRRVQQLAADENVYILTGAPYVDVQQQSGEKPLVRYANSSLLIDNTGSIVDRYDKQHLVPFGEYVPFARQLPFIKPLVENVGDFTPGKTRKPLSFGTIGLGVLICYESIFPDISRQWVEDGAGLLVNISNDAWYGRSSAPHQSMAMAVLRAVENRRSMVRAANTGISGFITASGRVQQASDLFTEAQMGASAPVMTTETFFTRRGYMFGPACLALIPVVLIFGFGKHRRGY